MAIDGESAIEAAKKGLPDAILLDIMMPGLDGYEVCEKLKDIENESGRKRDVPKFSARTLDIDIVLQINEDEILYESDEIEKYSFVSEPLKEVL